MQSLLTFLIQLCGKTWTALVVVIISGGAATVFYFSSANAGSNSTPTNPSVVVQPGQVAKLGAGAGCHPGPVPVVPEASAGLALIPVVAAMLFFSARRLWPTKPSVAGEGPSNPSVIS
jgi:hypothetical protein